MPIKKTFNRFIKNAARSAGGSGSRAQKAAETAQKVYVGSKLIKWGAIAGLIAFIVIFLGGAGGGATQIAAGLDNGLGTCTAPTDKSGFFDFLAEQGEEVSEEDKKTIMGQPQNGVCQTNGVGFNGEAYPPTAGRVTEWYNAFRDNPPRNHEGMDIAGSCGAPIYAFAGGEVIKAIPGSEGKSTAGNYIYPMGDIVIRHTNGFETRYLHANGSSYKVKVGDIVSAGDEIASQWTNGPSTGCHLHIEAFLNGERADMNDYLAACGFVYTKESSFNEFPEGPVQCGGGGVAPVDGGVGAGGDMKAGAKAQMKTLMNISTASVEKEFQCLNSLWERESNWRVNALNPAFDRSKPATPEYQAYGIVQAAPGSKMASEGADWKTNPQTQIRWGLKYIKARYGTPCGAWAQSEAVNWY